MSLEGINRRTTGLHQYICLNISTLLHTSYNSMMSRYSARSTIRRRHGHGLRTRRQAISKPSSLTHRPHVTRRRQVLSEASLVNHCPVIDRLDLLRRQQAKSRFPSTVAHRPLPFAELRHLVPCKDLDAEVISVCEIVGASLYSALTQVRLLDEQLLAFDVRVERARMSGQTRFVRSLVLQRAMSSGVRDFYMQRADRRVDFIEKLMSRAQRRAPGPRVVYVNTGAPSQYVAMTFQ